MSGSEESISEEFVWCGGGTKVELLGSFNDWQHPIALRRDGKRFTCTVAIAPGTKIIHYRFRVNGHIDHSDPSTTESVDDPDRGFVSVRRCAPKKAWWQRQRDQLWTSVHDTTCHLHKLFVPDPLPVRLRPLFGCLTTGALADQLRAADSNICIVDTDGDAIDCFCYVPVGRPVATSEMLGALSSGCVLALLLSNNQELAEGYMSTLRASHSVAIVLDNDVTELVAEIKSIKMTNEINSVS